MRKQTAIATSGQSYIKANAPTTADDERSEFWTRRPIARPNNARSNDLADLAIRSDNSQDLPHRFGAADLLELIGPQSSAPQLCLRCE
jgi:hypothetical protein